jgi:transposase-like protein
MSERGRPSKYKPEFCEQAIELGKLGKSPTQIACAFEVDRATLYRWAEEYEDFRTALTRAKAEEQNWWETTGMAALTADKFQAAVWKKSMEARFRDDYTERKELGGAGGGAIKVLISEDDAAL